MNRFYRVNVNPNRTTSREETSSNNCSTAWPDGLCLGPFPLCW